MEFSEAKPLISEEQNKINSEENQKNLKLNLIPNQKETNEKKNIEYDKIKLINNDDDYLGYNSKYQTSDIISEEKRTDSIDKAKSTTNSSSSQNDNNTPPRNGKQFFPNYIPYFNRCDFNSSNNRKMSSPVCLYYEGFDKYSLFELLLFEFAFTLITLFLLLIKLSSFIPPKELFLNLISL